MRRLISTFLALTLIFGLATSAVAQNSLRAAALVNDEIISVLDVILRLRMAIVSSGLEDTPEARDRLTTPVLRALIDERLQLQEAERLDIAVTDEQIDNGLNRLAEQNRMTRSQFLQSLRERGILEEAIRNQLLAQLSWREVVTRRLAPQVEIDSEEIEETVARITADASQPRVRVAEIFIAFDTPSEESEARVTAGRLLDEIQNGAPFQPVAQQFSQSATASVGGDMGWLAVQELPPELVEIVNEMQPGSLAGPIRTIGGYYIVALVDRRAAENVEDRIQLAEFIVPASGEDDLQVATAEAARLAEEVRSCAQANSLAQQYGGAGTTGSQPFDALSAEVRDAVSGLGIGQPSAPLEVESGVAVYTVCLREGGGIDRQAIESDLRAERLELLARRYMRDLRRDSNVEIRL
ncbi:peptidylprolyl isomerase [Algihabitans albus]|uniref:peptidylprolyl isomerase n=1 Tax=Algihabitans albus TaxID=2164067 RepID=UPI000E5C62D2|nr:peptidylprolyl isomerase [Algihabitans albus]